ncbi:hypothetical protein [Desulfovibrio sp. SGI.169]|uniref:hypothetical protein n=1 Tax=Desulfovibrio sp. SGI.169 TaxID=3420561 RepID=UPI003D0276FD
MGIITIFLLTCGRSTPARSLEFVNFKPFMASSALPALPTLSTSFRKQGSKQRHRFLESSAHGASGTAFVSGVIPAILHPLCFSRLPFFRDKGHIPGLHEIRGMLPFSLAPPVCIS